MDNIKLLDENLPHELKSKANLKHLFMCEAKIILF